jgi:hypothetical protein
MKKGIILITLALFVAASLSAQDQLRTHQKTQDKLQIHTPATDQTADQDMLQTRQRDRLQDPDQDQLKTKDQKRLHTNVATSAASPARGAVKNAGAASARRVQSASGAVTRAKAATRSGMGPKH